MSSRIFILAMIVAGWCGWAGPVCAVDRFPRPEFKSGYTLPYDEQPLARGDSWALIDTAVLVGALGLASYLALRRRSRRGLLLLSLFAIGYFGFWRQGCVCPVGSFQNVTQALSDPAYRMPLVVLAFFLIPLVFTLCFGRTFCASVCPLGAIQEVVLYKSVRMPESLARALSLLPYFVLALAVYYVVNGAAFIVCRYDPFVGFYRLSGPAPMILLGVVLLGLSVFVGRPYCRFGCPYGVLLRWTSVLAWRHVQTTPDDCMVCRLCEEACPFGAIQRPDAEPTQEKRATGRRRLGWMLLLLPVVVAVGAWTGHRLAPTLSALHPTIQLASLVQKFDAGQIPVIPVEVETFRASGQTADSLVTEVKRVRDRFNRTGWWLGGFLGMVVGLDLVRLSIYRRRAVYEVNRALCVSCGRCFQYCPKEHARLKKQKETQSR